MNSRAQRFLYVFLDEGGDLNFKANGSRYFTLTAVSMDRLLPCHAEFQALREELFHAGADVEYFHASEDVQATRDRVYGVIGKYLSEMRVDVIVGEKCKTDPPLQAEAHFYPGIISLLLGTICQLEAPSIETEVIVMTDRLPLSKEKNAVKAAIKPTLVKYHRGVYRLMHHDSKSNFLLQVADYVNWAVFRKWERRDLRSYDLIKSAIRSEMELHCVDGAFHLRPHVRTK